MSMVIIYFLIFIYSFYPLLRLSLKLCLVLYLIELNCFPSPYYSLNWHQGVTYVHINVLKAHLRAAQLCCTILAKFYVGHDEFTDPYNVAIPKLISDLLAMADSMAFRFRTSFSLTLPSDT